MENFNFTEDKTYMRWCTTPASQVPKSDMTVLISLFIEDAQINMGTTVDPQTLDRCIWHAQNLYGHLPINLIASGYHRGSIGDFGAGRLTPNTIKRWMDIITGEYGREKLDKEQEKIHSQKYETTNLHKTPIGSAINKKIEWRQSNAITRDEWDLIPIKQLAEDIAAGLNYGPAHYLEQYQE